MAAFACSSPERGAALGAARSAEWLARSGNSTANFPTIVAIFQVSVRSRRPIRLPSAPVTPRVEDFWDDRFASTLGPRSALRLAATGSFAPKSALHRGGCFPSLFAHSAQGSCPPHTVTLRE